MNIFDLLIVQPVFNLLIGLYSLIGDFGLSIIIFTILIRLALYPLVKKQLHQTKAMRKIQPELTKIRKQAKGNRQMQGMLMLELYKEHNIKPFRTILILLIQLPIFIALFLVIRILTNQRDRVADFAYSFMEQIPAVSSIITNPEQFDASLFGIIDLTGAAVSEHGLNIFLLVLAVVAAVTQYIMSKQTMPNQESKKRLRDIMAESAQGKEVDQMEMNTIMMSKMIKILPIFMFVIMVSVPGALALYYGVSNIVAVLQQGYLLRKDEDELEDIAEAGARKEARARAKKAKEAELAAFVDKQDRAKAAKKSAKKSSKKRTSNTKPKAASSTKVTRISAKDTKRKKG